MSDSEDEVFCGPITLKEMKIVFNKPPVTKSERRNTTVGFSLPLVPPKSSFTEKSLLKSYMMEENKENVSSNFIDQVAKTLFKDSAIPELKCDKVDTSPVNLSAAVLELHKEIDDKMEQTTDNYVTIDLEESTKYLSIKTEDESFKDILERDCQNLNETNSEFIETIEILDESVEEINTNVPVIQVTRPTGCFDESLDYEPDVNESIKSDEEFQEISSDDEDSNNSSKIFIKTSEKIVADICDTEEILESHGAKFQIPKIIVDELKEQSDTEEIQKRYEEISEEMNPFVDQRMEVYESEECIEKRRSEVSEEFTDSLEQRITNEEEFIISEHEMDEKNSCLGEEDSIKSRDSFERLLQNDSFDNYMIKDEIKTLIDNLESDEEEMQNNEIEIQKNLSSISEQNDQSINSSLQLNDTLEEMEMFLREYEQKGMNSETEKSTQENKGEDFIPEERTECREENYSNSVDKSDLYMNMESPTKEESRDENSRQLYVKMEHIRLHNSPATGFIDKGNKQNHNICHIPVKKRFQTPGKKPTNSSATPVMQRNAPKPKYFETPRSWKSPTAAAKGGEFKVPSKPLPKSCTKAKNVSPFKNVVSPVGAYINTNPVPAFVRTNIGKELVKQWEPLPDDTLPLSAPQTSSVSPALKKTPNSSAKLVGDLPVRSYKPPAKQIFLFQEDETKLPGSLRKLVNGALDSKVINHERREKAFETDSLTSFNDTASSLLNETAQTSQSADISFLVSTKGVKHY